MKKKTETHRLFSDNKTILMLRSFMLSLLCLWFSSALLTQPTSAAIGPETHGAGNQCSRDYAASPCGSHQRNEVVPL